MKKVHMFYQEVFGMLYGFYIVDECIKRQEPDSGERAPSRNSSKVKVYPGVKHTSYCRASSSVMAEIV